MFIGGALTDNFHVQLRSLNRAPPLLSFCLTSERTLSLPRGRKVFLITLLRANGNYVSERETRLFINSLNIGPLGVGTTASDMTAGKLISSTSLAHRCAHMNGTKNAKQSVRTFCLHHWARCFTGITRAFSERFGDKTEIDASNWLCLIEIARNN